MNTVDDYIAKLPKETRQTLQNVRQTIAKAVPQAEEAMSYGAPAFKLKGKNLVIYAAFKNHIGLYPEPETIQAFSKELERYETSKGTIRFPLDQPLPYQLIGRIAKHRAKQA